MEPAFHSLPALLPHKYRDMSFCRNPEHERAFVSLAPSCRLSLSSNIKINLKVAIQRLNLPFILPFINDAIRVLAPFIRTPVLALGQFGGGKVTVSFKPIYYPVVKSVLPVD